MRPSIAAGSGRRSERRAGRLRAVCVRTAAASVSRVITKSRSTWAGLHSPAWMASCGCAVRVILSGTHRGGAPSGTHYSLACAEVEWLPSCFRFGVGVVYITAHYRTHLPPSRAVFRRKSTPFALAGLSLTGIAVGLRSVGTGESELRKGAVSRSAGLYGHLWPGGGLSIGRPVYGDPGRTGTTIVTFRT